MLLDENLKAWLIEVSRSPSHPIAHWLIEVSRSPSHPIAHWLIEVSRSPSHPTSSSSHFLPFPPISLLEQVNVACSMASSSPLDKKIKDMLVTDMFHMMGIVPSDRKRAKDDGEEKKRTRLFKGNPAAIKQRNVFELQKISLRELSQSDLEIVLEAVDEYRRAGHWERIMPCPHMAKYMPLFEFPRYRNTVSSLAVSAWMR